MEHQHKAPQNVTLLDSYRRKPDSSAGRRTDHRVDRQRDIQKMFLDMSKSEIQDSPTAIVGFSVQPSGNIRSVARQIEPEHIEPILIAMRAMMTRLESYLPESTRTVKVLVADVAVPAQLSLVVAEASVPPAANLLGVIAIGM